MYKKLVSILLVVSMISCVCTSAFASERSDGYDASLALAGLSHEDYLSMAAETRNFYSHTQLINTQLETKYYRIVSSPSNNSLSTATYEVGLDSGELFVEEITENTYLRETSLHLRRTENCTVSLSDDSDTSSTNWAKMTTTLSEVAGQRKWVLSNSISVLGNPSSNGANYIAGLGVNSNCSIISGSSYCYRKYTFANESKKQMYYASDIQTKSNVGYAISMDATGLDFDNEIYLLVSFGEQIDDLNYIDGYGHFAMSEISSNYSMSFGLSGADFSISPSSYVSTMNNTHAQLTY